MGISIRQEEGSLYAGSGAIIGKAAAAQKKADEQHQAKLQADRLAAQLQGQQMAMDARAKQQEQALEWEGKKMEMRSQLEFEKEQRDVVREYEKANMVKDWEVEKMAMRSQADFAAELRETESVRNSASAGLKEIDAGIKSGKYTEEEVSGLRTSLELEKEMGRQLSPSHFRKDNVDPMDAFIKQMMAPEQQQNADTAAPTPETRKGHVWLERLDKNGNVIGRGQLPRGEADAAIAAGEARLLPGQEPSKPMVAPVEDADLFSTLNDIHSRGNYMSRWSDDGRLMQQIKDQYPAQFQRWLKTIQGKVMKPKGAGDLVNTYLNYAN